MRGNYSKPKMVYPYLRKNTPLFRRFSIIFHNYLTVDETNPHTLEYFRSEMSIMREKKRHYDNFWFTIHPLSKFKEYHDMYMIFLYTVLMILKPIDCSFIRVSRMYPSAPIYNDFMISSFVFDVLSGFSILVYLFTGYVEPDTKTVELSLKMIAKRYLFGVYFISDVLSSIPKYMFYHAPIRIFLFLNTCSLLKLVRLKTLTTVIRTSSSYLGIKSTKGIFLMSFILLTIILSHIMACLHFAAPRYRKMLTGTFDPGSWVVRNDVLSKVFWKAYILTHFRSTAYSMAVSINLQEGTLWEEIALAILNYVLGKLLIVTTWVVLSYVLLSAESANVRYQEIRMELNNFMVNRQLPKSLKTRLIEYYNVKYGRTFFNENFIKGLMPPSLKKEINEFLVKPMAAKVPLLKELPPDKLNQLLVHLVPEIYLPNDMIIYSGAFCDCMYFLISGTVALYSHSGNEVCHLEDGSVFGEIAMVMKDHRHMTTVTAVEVCKVYVLKKRQFDKYVAEDSAFYRSILKTAEESLEMVRVADEKRQRAAYAQPFRPV